MAQANLIPPAMIRDPKNPGVFITPPDGTPGAYDYQKPGSVVELIGQVNAAKADRNDKMIGTLSEEEAADWAFLSESEQEARARARGLVQVLNAGRMEYQWTEAAGGEKPASLEFMESLGIAPPTENKAQEERTIFDPMKAVLDKAVGVGKALEAERAAAKAAAEAEKEEAARAAAASPLPKVQPPTPRPTPLPTSRTSSPTAPRPTPTPTSPTPAPSQPPTRPKSTPTSPTRSDPQAQTQPKPKSGYNRNPEIL